MSEAAVCRRHMVTWFQHRSLSMNPSWPLSPRKRDPRKDLSFLTFRFLLEPTARPRFIASRSPACFLSDFIEPLANSFSPYRPTCYGWFPRASRRDDGRQCRSRQYAGNQEKLPFLSISKDSMLGATNVCCMQCPQPRLRIREGSFERSASRLDGIFR